MCGQALEAAQQEAEDAWAMVRAVPLLLRADSGLGPPARGSGFERAGLATRSCRWLDAAECGGGDVDS